MQKKDARSEGSREEKNILVDDSALAGQFSFFFLTLCLFSSRAFTRSIAAGVSAMGAFLCRRRRDRGEGAAGAGEGEEVDGVVGVR